MQQNIRLAGKPAEVLAQLRAIIAARKPEPKQIFRTTIITPETFVFKKVQIVGRVPQ